MFKVDVYIAGQRLDLFKDENISIVSSVQNIEDISRTFNDYSQSFTVPASANNNKIFKHWYNFSLTNGFDARVRHKAHIDIQSSNFKIGNIRLESCLIENNAPVHYKVTFFGQLIELKTVISDDYLSDLDFTAYDIDYNSDNVKIGLTTGFNSGDYIFPLISTKRQWYYNSNISDFVFEERLSNIGFNASATPHGIEWTSLRPALLINRIIEKIEQEYALTFSRDFLLSEPFTNLFLWLANTDSEDALKSIYNVADYNVVNTYQPSIGSYNNTTGIYTPTANGADNIREVDIRFFSSDGISYTVQLLNGDNVLVEETSNGNIAIDFDIPNGLQQGDNLYLRVVTSTAKTITSMNVRIKELSEDTVLFNEKFNFTIEGATASIKDFMPKLKVLDFLKSIINMYNLVVVPITETSFYLQTLDEWYAEGNVYDISKYVDTNSVTVDRPKIYNDIKFSFQEPQTILADRFNQTNNSAYGDLETKLKNADGTSLDGESFEIEVSFEQMLYERLFDLNNDQQTNVVYGLSLDDALGEVLPEAHIFYGIQRNVSANPLAFVDDTGAKTVLNTNVWMPSHSESNAQKYSTCWGGEINEHTGAINNNSLYKLYYDDYIKDSFSIKRRQVSLKCRLPLHLLTSLKLNDKLIINGDRYIINQMTTNVTEQMVDFQLLNDIYNDAAEIVVEEVLQVESSPVRVPTTTNSRSFGISSTGSTIPSTACGLSVNSIKYWNGAENKPTLADTIYTNSGLTTTFNGGNNYYKIADSYILKINASGVVTDLYFCSTGGVGGNA